MEHCKKCNFEEISSTFSYCPQCGTHLTISCAQCGKSFRHTSNYCAQCGNSLHRDKKQHQQQRNKSHLNSSPFNQAAAKPTEESIPMIKTSDSLKLKLKVALLKGPSLEVTKHESAGGTRNCYLSKHDRLDTILKTICNIYFPKQSNQVMGPLCEYEISLLDFKKERLISTNFTTFHNYTESNGLQLNIRPIFYLHLLKKAASSSSFNSTSSTTQSSSSFSSSSSPNSITIDKPRVIIKSLNQKSSPINTNNANTNNKSLNESVNSNERKRFRDNSPISTSSSSSVSSSQSIASFKNAKKLNKQLNDRIEKAKNDNNDNGWKTNVNNNNNNNEAVAAPNVPLYLKKYKSTVNKEVEPKSETVSVEPVIKTEAGIMLEDKSLAENSNHNNNDNNNQVYKNSNRNANYYNNNNNHQNNNRYYSTSSYSYYQNKTGGYQAKWNQNSYENYNNYRHYHSQYAAHQYYNNNSNNYDNGGYCNKK